MALLPINTSSYDTFRSDALTRAGQGLGYDVSGYYGYQCWDLAAELWMNLSEFAGHGLYPQTGPNYAAAECWTVSRTQNAGNSFDLIYDLREVKRGDVIVLGASAISDVGHIAFADSDYNIIVESTGRMDLLGQNQVNPSLYYGHIPTVTNLSVTAFLGAFRYKGWEQPEPETPTETKKHFPWPVAWRTWGGFKRVRI